MLVATSQHSQDFSSGYMVASFIRLLTMKFYSLEDEALTPPI